MKKVLTALFVLFFLSVSVQAEDGYINLDSREEVFDKSNLLPYLFGQQKKDGWSVLIDAKDDLVFTVVVDSLNGTKGELFNKALSYFTYNYVNGKNVLQTQDKNAGLIIAKGNYPDRLVSSEKHGGGMIWSQMEMRYVVEHIIRIDLKDNKARIIISINDFEINGSVFSSDGSNQKMPSYKAKISEIAPIKNYNDTTGLYIQLCSSLNRDYLSQSSYERYVKKGRDFTQKTHDANIKGFDGICKDVISTILGFEESMRKGNTSTENDSW